MYSDLSKFCIFERSSILDAMKLMDESRLGIVLVVDKKQRLVGTITDGDTRRAVLANVDLSMPAETLLAYKAGSPYAHPITARAGEDQNTYLKLFQQHSICHIPLLGNDQRVVGLITLSDFLPDQVLPVQAVVMAGGAGRRLHPLTEDLPKPMLPVGDRPLMEIIIAQLREVGIRRVNVTTHHKSEKITEHFGNGDEFGVELKYIAEDSPLGTAGALGLMEKPQEPLLVVNGDILTQVDFRAMLTYHREQAADLTMAVRQYDLQVPYGVVECDGPVVRGLTEKPVMGFFVNAGIYLLEPVVHGLIPAGQRLDMTDLIQQLLDGGRPVASFPIRENWLDIGCHEDYRRAQENTRRWNWRS